MKKAVFALLLTVIFFFAACNDYGDKIKISNKTEVYITGAAGRADGEKLGRYIDTLYREGNERSLQLSKDSGIYTVKLPVDADAMQKDPSLLQSFMALRFLLKQKIFPGSEVKLILTDGDFETYRVVRDTTFSEN